MSEGIALSTERVGSAGDPDFMRALEVFIGPNADAYLRHYLATRSSGRRTLRGLSWPAFFVPLPWMLYRKLYLEAIGMLAAAVFAAYALPQFFPEYGRNATMGLWVGFAVVAKSIYLLRAERRVRAIVARNLPPAEHDAALRRAGGVSIIGAVMGSVLMLAGLVLSIAGGTGSGHLADRFMTRAASGATAPSVPSTAGVPACNAASVRDLVADLIGRVGRQKGRNFGDARLGRAREVQYEEGANERYCAISFVADSGRYEMDFSIQPSQETPGKFRVQTLTLVPMGSGAR